MTDRRKQDPTSSAPDTESTQVLDHLFEGCQIISPDWRYLYVNETVARHARVHRLQLLNRRMTEVFPGIDRTPVFDALRRTMADREPRTMENRFDYEDGSVGWFELRLAPVPEGVFILSLDITERKATEERLRRSEAMLRRTELIALVGSWEWEIEPDVVTWSTGLYRLMGLDSAAPPPSFADHGALFHEQDWPRLLKEVEAAAAEGSSFELELRVIRTDGDVRRCEAKGQAERDDSGRIIRLFGSLQDVTETRKLEEQLLQQQKMDSIGALAGGIAHDFNNLLMAQLGFCDLLLEESDTGAPRTEDLNQIRACAERAATLTRQLLAFSRRQALLPVALDLNEVLTGLSPLLQRLIGEDVHMEMHLAPSLHKTVADPAQIEQVVMNLAVNAREAMPKGGRLTLETADVELDETYTKDHVGAAPGPYVMIAVSDTGHGMDETTRRRVFEPFFTTKALGRGTGLGLSMVFGIVKQSGGNIWVYSEPGEGTTFKVYLPRETGTETPQARPVPGEVRGGTETVLVVEDDETVRSLMTRMLGRLGYDLHVYASAREALDEVLAETIRPDVLLTDVVMPDMGGKELATRLSGALPGLPVIYMSGYTENAIVHHGVLEADVIFLQKPFSLEELAGCVRGALDRPG